MTDNDTFDDKGASTKVDFDKLIQSLVTTLEHPDPFVRKVAMYWMSRIVKAYMGGDGTKPNHASTSVRNSVPHVLPGILLSIGDTFHTRASTKDSFLPDQTTHSLAQQTNDCLQASVQRDGKAYATHLDGFLVALREELDSPGKDPSAAVERKQYRMDVTTDGSGIESTGWFRASSDTPKTYEVDATSKSRLCALEWVVVLYESVVPDLLKAEFAREFVSPIIHQLVGNPPELIIRKSLEVLAKITVPVPGETLRFASLSDIALTNLISPGSSKGADKANETPEFVPESPMTNSDAIYALEILTPTQGNSKSRDRSVFSALIQLHAHNHQLLADLSRVIQIMCSLQPPEFVFVSFAVEMDAFVRQSMRRLDGAGEEKKDDANIPQMLSSDLNFVSSFIQQMSHVLLVTNETKALRELLRDCIGRRTESERDKRRMKLFHILLYSFSHNLVASTSLCLWAGAYRTASYFLQSIDPLDINLVFLLEVDHMVELLERPLFRHFHLRMLEADDDPYAEGSGAMLFRTLALLLMIVPQSTCYRILRDRLATISRFRQSALVVSNTKGSVDHNRTVKQDNDDEKDAGTRLFASRVMQVRQLHCDVAWDAIRSESLESPSIGHDDHHHDVGSHRREWLGFASKEEEEATTLQFQEEKMGRQGGGLKIEELREGSQYDQLQNITNSSVSTFVVENDDSVTASRVIAAGPTTVASSQARRQHRVEGVLG
ncbi:Vacuolar protein 14 C-terminal Fig4p binding [Fragilaria crotonensis]|nr:Vacuolar protein 14 C-terminal Fig4p binding [Fragilaria crotonensis]